MSSKPKPPVPPLVAPIPIVPPPKKFKLNWSLMVSILIPSAVTILGWFYANSLAAERDRTNKLRDIKITYLIDAYRKMANAAQRKDTIKSYHRDIESVVSDIQLFGSPEQVNILLAALAETNKKMKDSSIRLDMDGILNSLRGTLRAEIQLEQLDGNVRWFRFDGVEQKDTVLSKE